MVDAALAILREEGAAALTARAVAERAGTAVGTVYLLFGSLEALKLEANAVTMRLLRNHLTDELAAGRSDEPADRLICLADAYLVFARANHHAWAAIFDRRTIEPPPAIAADIAALFAIIDGVLAAIEGLDPDAIPVVSKALWSSVHGMVYLGELGGLGPVGRDDVPAMVETLVRAAVRGLRVGSN
ncbi:TetR/AcrR family transcriptional regulator [uncultured Enterovirga sp.]|uniref:TetR/AcrR family transcriptional regulator n=1 Tax=uncultured Enterovirga sp. TaxID=2026352 RepID=UPI0035CA57C2